MVTLEPSVLVTVSDADRLLPTVTLPKARLLGLDPSAPGAIPVPDKGMVKVGLGAFEVIVTLPLAFATSRFARPSVLPEPSVSERACLLPTVTLPKFSLAGLSAN
jgi:hypothetical protein